MSYAFSSVYSNIGGRGVARSKVILVYKHMIEERVLGVKIPW